MISKETRRFGAVLILGITRNIAPLVAVYKLLRQSILYKEVAKRASINL